MLPAMVFSIVKNGAPWWEAAMLYFLHTDLLYCFILKFPELKYKTLSLYFNKLFHLIISEFISVFNSVNYTKRRTLFWSAVNRKEFRQTRFVIINTLIYLPSR